MALAYSYEVPVSYTINVSLTSNPSGLADYNTNNIAIFTNEAAGFSENYRAYFNPSGVESDFGSNSLTYKMARALFTPVPNFRTGNGVLYVFPYNATNATAGYFLTTNISSNVTAFQNVADGELSITIDGVTEVVSDLDFTKIVTINDIATVIKNKNLDVYIEVIGNTIKFTSKRFGSSSGVTINAISEGSGTDISASGLLNATAGASTVGTDAGGTTLAEAVTTALKQIYFGGVLSTQFVEDETLLANSTALQALDLTYFEALTSLKDIAETGAAVKTAGNNKTRLLAYSMNADIAKVAVATYATIAKSVNYNGSNTANTLNLKTLTGVIGDSNLSDTYVLSAANNGVDIYGITGGLSVVYSNDNNGYTDDIEANLWHKKATEVAGFNYLRQITTKIPQTEQGMTGLKNAYATVCETSIKNGTVAAGTWNSPIPFGDPEDFARNISERGYYIYSIPVSQQNQTDREARKAPVVQIAIKRSGAFHFSDVIITVER